MVVGRCRDANPVCSHVSKCKTEGGTGRLSHKTLVCGFLSQPVAELAGAVEMCTRLQTDRADKCSIRPLTKYEAQRAAMVPVGGACLQNRLLAVAIRVELNPR